VSFLGFWKDPNEPSRTFPISLFVHGKSPQNFGRALAAASGHTPITCCTALPTLALRSVAANCSSKKSAANDLAGPNRVGGRAEIDDGPVREHRNLASVVEIGEFSVREAAVQHDVARWIQTGWDRWQSGRDCPNQKRSFPAVISCSLQRIGSFPRCDRVRHCWQGRQRG